MNIEDLQNLIDQADEAYYSIDGEPTLSDAEYDHYKAQLKSIDPDNVRLIRVGHRPINPLRTKVHHSFPMGSLDNTDGGIEGYEAWYKSIATDAKVMASLKMDGASIRAKYVRGILVEVATRGNGIVGEDITQNALKFQNLPHKLSKEVDIDIRGEAILHKKDFEKICEEEHGIPFSEIEPGAISNPRNVGNGILGRDDGHNSDLIHFYAFDLHTPRPNKISSEEHKLAYLKQLGFTTVDHILCSSQETLKSFYNKVLEKRDNLKFEIDGIVVVLNEHSLKQFHITDDIKTKMRPKYARAIKFPHRSATTKLLDVLLTVGHTGAIIPTAKVETVRVGGVNVSNVLLNNFDEIKRLKLGYGDTVIVGLAGDIIPKIFGKLEDIEPERPILEPTNCPACDSPTTRENRGKDGAVTYCTNSLCSAASLAKISQWIGGSKKGVGILGIGDGILQAMWESGLVKDPSDLYLLKPEDLANLELDGLKVGQSRANGIIKEIKDKSELDIEVFLGSLGIDLLGRRRVQLLAKASTNYDLGDINNWLDTDSFSKLELPGMGSAIKDAIVDGINSNRELIHKLLKNGVSIKTKTSGKVSDLPFAGLSFCLTGTRECSDDIERLGGELKSGVSKTLSYLVQKDATSNSTKTQKADKYGVPVISIDFLKDVIAGKSNLGEVRVRPPETVVDKSLGGTSNNVVDPDSLVEELFG